MTNAYCQNVIFLYFATPNKLNKGNMIKLIKISIIKFTTVYNKKLWDVNLKIQKVPTAKIP